MYVGASVSHGISHGVGHVEGCIRGRGGGMLQKPVNPSKYILYCLLYKSDIPYALVFNKPLNKICLMIRCVSPTTSGRCPEREIVIRVNLVGPFPRPKIT